MTAVPRRGSGYLEPNSAQRPRLDRSSVRLAWLLPIFLIVPESVVVAPSAIAPEGWRITVGRKRQGNVVVVRALIALAAISQGHCARHGEQRPRTDGEYDFAGKAFPSRARKAHFRLFKVTTVAVAIAPENMSHVAVAVALLRHQEEALPVEAWVDSGIRRQIVIGAD